MSELPLPFDQLNPQGQAIVHDICIEFEQSWKNDGVSAIRRHASETHSESLTQAILTELVYLDASLRLRCGERPDPDDYSELDVDSKLVDAIVARALLEAVPISPELVDYQILDEIGSGAMGVVNEAIQKHTNRTVAIKFRRQGDRSTESDRRFQTEIRAAGRLSHPNIVSVLAAGDNYIVMEYVAGETLSERRLREPWSHKLSARLVRAVANALHYAHEKGVIHRDLKPSNILVDSEDRPRVADFGLAICEDESRRTKTGMLLGTPAYMSPEQARGDSEIGHLTDVYSLGVILYELLTGSVPFSGNTMSVLRQIREDDVPKPRDRRSDIPSELETICLKCLEKSPGNRFATAGELAEQLALWLANDEISVRPKSALRQKWDWVNRTPIRQIAATSILTISILCLWYFIHLRSVNSELEIALQERSATAEELKATTAARTRTLIDLSMSMGTNHLNSGSLLESLPHFAEAARLDSSAAAEGHRMRLASVLRYSPELVNCRHEAGVIGLDWNHARQQVVSWTKDRIRLWRPGSDSSRDFVLTPNKNGRSHTIGDVRLSQDGRILAVRCSGGSIHVWNLHTGNDTNVIHSETRARAFEISHSGEFVATADASGGVQIWHTDPVRRHAGPLSHPELVRTLVFSQDDRRLLCGYGGPVTDNVGGAQQWNVRTGEKVGDNLRHRDDVLVAAFGGDGQIATGDWRGDIRIWRNNSLSATLSGHAGEITGIRFLSGDDSLLSVAGTVAMIWSLSSGSLSAMPITHPADIEHFEVAENGNLITACHDEYLRIYSTDSIPELLCSIPVGAPIVDITLTGNDLVVCADANGLVRVWDHSTIGSPDRRLTHRGCEHVSLVPGRDMCVVSTGTSVNSKTPAKVCWYNRNLDERLRELSFTKRVTSQKVSPDGKFVAYSFADLTSRIWNLENGTEFAAPDETGIPGRVIGFIKDSTGVVVVNKVGEISTLALDGSQFDTAMSFVSDNFLSESIALNAARLCIVGVTQDGVLKMLDVNRLRPVASAQTELTKTELRNSVLALSPHGKLAVIGLADGRLFAWRTDSQHIVSLQSPHLRGLSAIRFGPSGEHFATASRDTTVQLWSVKELNPVGMLMKHDDEVNDVIFSPDGGVIGTAAGGDEQGSWGVARVWQVPSGYPVTPWLEHGNDVHQVRFDENQQQIYTTSWDGIVSRWALTTEYDPRPDRLADILTVFDMSAYRLTARQTPNRPERTIDAWNRIRRQQKSHYTSPAAERRRSYTQEIDESLYTQGFRHLRHLEFDAAGDVFEELGSSGSVLGLLGEGWRHIYLGRYESAVTRFERIAIDRLRLPAQKRAYYRGLIKSLIALKQVEKAEEILNSYLAESPTSTRERATQIELSFELKDPDAAMAAAHELAADDTVIGENLVASLKRRQRDQKFESLLENAEGYRNYRFAVFHSLPLANLGHVCRTLKRANYAPWRLRPYRGPEGIQFAGIFLRIRGEVDLEIVQGTSAEKILEHVRERRSRGLYLQDLAGCVNDDETLYFAALTNVHESAEQVVLVGESQAEFAMHQSELSADGLTLRSLQVFRNLSGKPRISGIWTRSRNAANTQIVDRNAEQEESNSTAARFLDVDLFMAADGKPRIRQCQTAEADSGTESLVTSDMPSQLSACHRHTEDGLIPVGISVILNEETGHACTATLWSQHSIDPAKSGLVSREVWTPPPGAHPKTIRDEANVDAAHRRFDLALQKMVWYHHKSLDYPSLAGVRLSFALRDWLNLAGRYEPAMDSLLYTRDQAGIGALTGDRRIQSFREFAGINHVLRQSDRTTELFLKLHEEDRAFAKEVYRSAEHALIESHNYEVAAAYVDGDETLSGIVEIFHNQVRAAGANDKQFQQVAEDYLMREAAKLAALLVVKGESEKAQNVVDTVKKIHASPRHDAMLSSALNGNFP